MLNFITGERVGHGMPATSPSSLTRRKSHALRAEEVTVQPEGKSKDIGTLITGLISALDSIYEWNGEPGADGGVVRRKQLRASHTNYFQLVDSYARRVENLFRHAQRPEEYQVGRTTAAYLARITGHNAWQANGDLYQKLAPYITEVNRIHDLAQEIAGWSKTVPHQEAA